MSLTEDEAGYGSASTSSKTSEKENQGLPVLVACKAATRIEPTKKFHEKVFDLVENEVAPDALWWLEEGDVFVIRPKNFDEELSHHFRGNKFASMLRNMNRWGFVRINHSRVPFNCVAYWHKNFQHGKRHLLSQMKERKKNDKTTHDGVQLHEIYARLDRNGETTTTRSKVVEKTGNSPQQVESHQDLATSSPLTTQMEAPELVASSALRNQFSRASGFNSTSSSQLAMGLYPPHVQDKLSSILLQQGPLHRQGNQQQNLVAMLEQKQRNDEEKLRARILQQQKSDSIQSLLDCGYPEVMLGASGLNSSTLRQGGTSSSLLAGAVALVEEQRRREIIRLLQAAGEGCGGQHLTTSTSSMHASLEHQRGLSALEILAKLKQLP